MSEYTLLAIYCFLVLIVSLGGGSLPFVGKVTHGRLQFYLSLSAGVMLGASFFHVMPDAIEKAGPQFGWWMSLAVIGLFCIERFIAPHSHEVGGNGHQHNHSHEHGHSHEHAHHHDAVAEQKQLLVLGNQERAVAPPVAGWAAVFGLTIHTFMNGLGMAAVVNTDVGKSMFAGLGIFLAIALHKPADALAISTVLSRKGISRRIIGLVQLSFALTVPIGVAAFYLVANRLTNDTKNQLTGAALAFSAGTFLFVALSDLLPEVQFHRHDRIPLFLTLAASVAFMGFIALLEDHDADAHDKAPTAQHEKATLEHTEQDSAAYQSGH